MSRVRALVLLKSVPLNADLALLVLRVWLGLTLLYLHGWGKLSRLLDGNTRFRSVFGLPEAVSLAMAAGAEVFGAALIVVGLATRLASLAVSATLATAFVVAHGAALKGAGNGELPFVFLAGFLALFLAGPGRYSLDEKISQRI